jgi:cytochrome c-type biogenesis protein CcmH/NrfG
LAAIIEKLLAKSRDARFQSADEVARLLERCLAHLQHPTAVPLPDGVSALAAEHRRSKSAARWVLLSGLAMIVLLAAIASLMWDRWHGDDLQTHAGPAQAPVVQPPAHESTDPPLSDEITRWNDGMEQTLREIQADLQMLEQGPSW